MQLANVFQRHLEQDASGLFQIVAPPKWALVVFRLKSERLEQGQVEELNKAFWNDLQELADKFVLTQTSLPEVGFCVRFVVGSPQTRKEHVDQTWALIAQTARRTWERFSSDNALTKA